MSRALFGSDVGTILGRHPDVTTRVRRRQIRTVLTALAIIAPVGLGFLVLNIDLRRLWSGLFQLVWFVELMIPPIPKSSIATYMTALGQTLGIAFLGTTLAAVLAFPFGFLAARNIVPRWIFRSPVRRGFDLIRSVDTLIWALVWINVVGLGPFAGVLAIASSDFGSFGKLFSEAIETAESKSVEGIRSTGGGFLHEIRFAIVPQVLPVLASQVLYFFESNTRSATIIGIVGAGGLGLYLSEQIRTFEWRDVSFIVLLILVTVAMIDLLSTRLRAALSAPAAR